MSELKPWEIQYFRSGGFINKDHDMARIYKDLPIVEGRRLLKELNTRPDLKAELVENRTIYDAASKLDERVRQAAPNLVVALKNLLDAVEERPALADSIESKVLSEARILVENLKVNTIMGDTE